MLENLGVPYLIGGSLASAVHGVMRATLDSDLVAKLQPSHVTPFVAALRDEFYADPEAILEAIEHRASFNIIHRETMFKVDVFVSRERPFDQAQFHRRVGLVHHDRNSSRVFLSDQWATSVSPLERFRHRLIEIGDER